MRVKPKAGKMVRDPISLALLPENGRNVPNNTFWRRRLRDGDIELVSDVKPAPAPASSPEKKSSKK